MFEDMFKSQAWWQDRKLKAHIFNSKHKTDSTKNSVGPCALKAVPSDTLPPGHHSSTSQTVPPSVTKYSDAQTYRGHLIQTTTLCNSHRP